MNRRLAAILAADMVGYSRLMHSDELGTLQRQKEVLREIIRPAIAEHRGRLVKTTGDGLLVEFVSAMDAVMCAVAIQRGLGAHGDEIVYRIGINLGEIIDEDGDIFGDGVNVAARLEGVAAPGSICISESVYATIKGKLNFGFARLGAQRLKNISDPVNTYSVLIDEDDAGKLTWVRQPNRRRLLYGVLALLGALVIGAVLLDGPRDSPALATPSDTRLLILPFASDDPSTDIFAEAASENMWRSMDRVLGMTIVPRARALELEGVTPTPEMLRDLGGVTHILESDIARNGEDIAIESRLRRAGRSDVVLWQAESSGPAITFMERLVRKKAEVLSSLNISLTTAEREIIEAVHTRDAGAYALYARGMGLLDEGLWDDILPALQAFEEAATLDPNFTEAKIGAARANFAAWSNGWNISIGTRDALSDMTALVEEVLEGNPNHGEALALKVSSAVFQLRHDEAVSLAQGAVFRNRDAPVLRRVLALALMTNGDAEGAAAELALFRQTAPRLTFAEKRTLMWFYLRLGDLDAVEALLEEVRLAGQTHSSMSTLEAEFLARSGNLERAQERMAQVLISVPFFNVTWGALPLRPFRDPSVRQTYVEAMNAAGAPLWPFDYDKTAETTRLDSTGLTLLVAPGFRATDATDPLGEPVDLAYWPDGRVEIHFTALDAPPFVGQWEIEGDMLCLTVPGVMLGYRFCDMVFRDADRWDDAAPRYVQMNAFGLFRFGVAPLAQ